MAGEHVEGCPLAAVDRRLEDAHQLWHQALDQYHSVDGIRLPLQNCIQTLRTVSFVLQYHKRAIPEFDKWYSGWQEKMKLDPILVWAVEARNNIEKRGDLEKHSRTTATIIASHFDEFRPIDLGAATFDTNDDLRIKAQGSQLAKHIFEHGSLQIERRWIANDLPDVELMDALAHIYGQLSLLVSDAHTQMGLPTPKVVLVNSDGKHLDAGDKLLRAGKMPCMVQKFDSRKTLISLQDGSTFEPRFKALEVSSADVSKAVAHYNMTVPEKLRADPDSLEKLAEPYFEIARQVFLKDGHHQTIGILTKNNKPIAQFNADAKDRSEKYIISRLLGELAEQHDADGIMLISEVWSSAANTLATFEFPADDPNRSELLTLNAISKSGEAINFHAEISRLKGLALGETEVGAKVQINTFDSVRTYWDGQG